MEEPMAGEKYVHFRGSKRIYEVVAMARDCDNPTQRIVVYKQLYPTVDFPEGTIWTRSLDDFCGDKEIIPGIKVKRFKRI
ncbi:MAG: DUF1653 domain-containing protein [archaeon]|nr:DUF1653 domain-containing protein [archaeon]MCR4323635.1 DUF1653 domain-containing protein [Nanoarchaeota archaeon]